MDTKTHIRKEKLKQRSVLSFDERKKKSDCISKALFNLKEFKEADLILLYKDYKNEVMTEGIYQKAVSLDKTIAYPRVNGEDMDFYIVNSADELKEGYKGIFEPVERCLIVKSEDIVNKKVLMVLPGAAFDKAGNRIGYGKGFYDRYIHKMPYITTVAIGYNLQIADEIPAEAFDKPVDYVITENDIIICKK